MFYKRIGNKFAFQHLVAVLVLITTIASYLYFASVFPEWCVLTEKNRSIPSPASQILAEVT